MLITSDKSYKNLEVKRGYHENDILGGKDPLASKGSAELVIQSHLSSFFQRKILELGLVLQELEMLWEGTGQISD